MVFPQKWCRLDFTTLQKYPQWRNLLLWNISSYCKPSPFTPPRGEICGQREKKSQRWKRSTITEKHLWRTLTWHLSWTLTPSPRAGKKHEDSGRQLRFQLSRRHIRLTLPRPLLLLLLPLLSSWQCLRRHQNQPRTTIRRLLGSRISQLRSNSSISSRLDCWPE